MAFRYVAKPVFAATVNLTVAGQEAPGQLAVVFRHKGIEQYNAWLATLVGRSDVDNLFDIIEDLPDLEDEHGEAVPYSRAALERLVNDFPPSPLEILAAYRRALLESRAKN